MLLLSASAALDRSIHLSVQTDISKKETYFAPLPIAPWRALFRFIRLRILIMKDARRMHVFLRLASPLPFLDKKIKSSYPAALHL